MVLGVAILAVGGAVLAQDEPAKPAPKKTSSHATAGAATRGKEVFDKKCGKCHFADSDAKKIRPGFEGPAKPGTFTVKGKKITTERPNPSIENTHAMMTS